MLSIERFAQQHFGITLTEYQVKLIKVITETPEKDYVLHYPTEDWQIKEALQGVE